VSEAERAKNSEKSRVRSRVERVIGVIKLKFGFSKVRYRGNPPVFNGVYS
jgi:transposase, IS5 family